VGSHIRLPVDRPCNICGRSAPEVDFRIYNGRRQSGCVSCLLIRSRANRAKHFEEYKATRQRSHYQREYGLESITLETLYQEQQGRCGICETPIDSVIFGVKNRYRTVVDHDHLTNKVRGLLCHLCNAGLGMFKDNPENLMRAYSYLAWKNGRT